jgi:hypothetical protein
VCKCVCVFVLEDPQKKLLKIIIRSNSKQHENVCFHAHGNARYVVVSTINWVMDGFRKGNGKLFQPCVEVPHTHHMKQLSHFTFISLFFLFLISLFTAKRESKPHIFNSLVRIVSLPPPQPPRTTHTPLLRDCSVTGLNFHSNISRMFK